MSPEQIKRSTPKSSAKGRAPKNKRSRIEYLFSDLEPQPVDPHGKTEEKITPLAQPYPIVPAAAHSAKTQPPAKPEHVPSIHELIGDSFSPLIWQSLEKGNPIVVDALRPAPADLPHPADGHSAIVAYGRLLGHSTQSAGSDAPSTDSGEANLLAQSALLMEILDSDPKRAWSEEELQLVEQVTDQLTLALENAHLFQQTQDALRALQSNLAETEALYQASARLNIATTYNEILDVLLQYTVLGHPSAIEVSMGLFEGLPWNRQAAATGAAPYPNQKRSKYPEDGLKLLPLAHWKNERKGQHSEGRVSTSNGELQSKKGAAPDMRWIAPGLVLHPDQATWISDVAANTSLDEPARQFYLHELGVQCLLCLPLNVSGRWFGHIIAAYDQPSPFSEAEIRPLMTLAAQAAVAVENARLFKSTQIALEETETLYQASAELNAAQTFDDILITLRKYSILEDVDHSLSLDLFDHPWVSTHQASESSASGMPEKALQAARWITDSSRSETVVNESAPPPGAKKRRKTGDLHPETIRPQAIGKDKADSKAASSDQEHPESTGTATPPLRRRILRKTGELRPQSAAAPIASAQADESSSQPLTRETIDQDEDAGSWPSLQSVYMLEDFPPARNLLRPDTVVAIQDIFTDPRVDEQTRHYYRQLVGLADQDADQQPSISQSVLYVPLVLGGLWIGFIHAVFTPIDPASTQSRDETGEPESEEPRSWSDAQIRRIEVLASQAAVAAQNLRQVQQIQTRAQYEYLIREISSAVSSTIEKDAILRLAARSLAVALNISHVAIYFRGSPQGQKEISAYLYDRAADQFQSGDTQSQLELMMDHCFAAFGKSRATGDGTHIAPITLRGQDIGEISALDLSGETEWTENDNNLLQTIAAQLALSLDNARLFQETQGALTETETLYQASAEINLVQSYQDILNPLRKHTILGQADRLLTILLFNRPWKRSGATKRSAGQGKAPAPLQSQDLPERITPVATWSPLPASRLRNFFSPRDYSASTLLSPNDITVLNDISNDPRLDYQARDLFANTFQGRSAIFIPLTVGGEWVGFINGIYSLPVHLDENEKRRLTALSSQAAIAIQNLRLLEETRRRAGQLQTAAEIARDTSTTLSLHALLQRAVNLICERFNYDYASIFLVDENGKEAVIQEATGLAGEEMKRISYRLPVNGESIIGQATGSGRVIVINDITSEKGQILHRANPFLPNTRAEICIPLKISERVIGALDVQANQPDVFSEDDVGVLSVLADQIAVAVDNARAYELSQEAYRLSQKAVEEIREADRLKTQFLANMSHELRTPLNSIIGFSRVILKGIDGPVTDVQATDLTAIYNAGQHLLGLINDVLDLSKIEAGKMELSFEENINLGEIIKSVMSTTVGLVKDKSVELQQIIDPELPLLRIDPMKIRQVLLNLLSNAAKFTETGSITVQASLQDGPDGQPEVMVKVIDTGPGIAPEDQIKLFQPFSQVDGSLTRKTGGSGLGLSICHHLIRMHGGRIGLSSQVGQGSTFFFTLPVKGPLQPVESPFGAAPGIETLIIDQVPARPGSSAPVSAPEASQNKVNKTPYVIELPPPIKIVEGSAVKPRESQYVSQSEIETEAKDAVGDLPSDAGDISHDREQIRSEGLVLAIDSDPQVINLYRRYLSNHNYTLISLTELSQAITVARGLLPMAITLDISMTGSSAALDSNHPDTTVDGWQTLKLFKDDPITTKIPIIVCSLLDERERAFRLGASAYLLKPILEDDLIQAIHSVSRRQAKP